MINYDDFMILNQAFLSAVYLYLIPHWMWLH